MTDDAPKIVPTWGYHTDGRSQIFQLEEGENLPEGWSDAPVPVEPSDDMTDEELEELTAPSEDTDDDDA